MAALTLPLNEWIQQRDARMSVHERRLAIRTPSGASTNRSYTACWKTAGHVRRMDGVRMGVIARRIDQSVRPLLQTGVAGLVAAIAVLGTPLQEAQAQQGTAADSTANEEVPQEDGAAIKARYNEGLEFVTADGNNRLHLELRFQFRYFHPFDRDPDEADDITDPVAGTDVSTLRIQRTRLRIGGHAHRPWLRYYLEYDWLNARLLDFRVTLSKIDQLQLRVGQWKPEYTRERRASSRELQFVDRSLVNHFFTIDRQQGLMVFGRLAEGSTADSRYFIGAFSGNGARTGNDDTDFMWLARYQWNFLGRDLEYAMSDLAFREKPAASLALAGVTNRSRCTRFSSSGCGQLPGFEDGEPAQYLVQQALGEFALKYNGLSTQAEYHWKRVEDDFNDTVTKLTGGYVQFGYFFHAAIPSFPRPLELAFRYARVDPNQELESDALNEYTLGINWFFSGHRNKISADASMFTAEDTEGSRTRIRVQWEVSF
jgi:phosphate-selective porin